MNQAVVCLSLSLSQWKTTRNQWCHLKRGRENQPSLDTTVDNKLTALFHPKCESILDWVRRPGPWRCHVTSNQSYCGVECTMIGRRADQMTLYSCVIGGSRFTEIWNENTGREWATKSLGPSETTPYKNPGWIPSQPHQHSSCYQVRPSFMTLTATLPFHLSCKM